MYIWAGKTSQRAAKLETKTWTNPEQHCEERWLRLGQPKLHFKRSRHALDKTWTRPGQVRPGQTPNKTWTRPTYSHRSSWTYQRWWKLTVWDELMDCIKHLYPFAIDATTTAGAMQECCLRNWAKFKALGKVWSKQPKGEQTRDKSLYTDKGLARMNKAKLKREPPSFTKTAKCLGKYVKSQYQHD